MRSVIDTPYVPMDEEQTGMPNTENYKRRAGACLILIAGMAAAAAVTYGLTRGVCDLNAPYATSSATPDAQRAIALFYGNGTFFDHSNQINTNLTEIARWTCDQLNMTAYMWALQAILKTLAEESCKLQPGSVMECVKYYVENALNNAKNACRFPRIKGRLWTERLPLDGNNETVGAPAKVFGMNVTN